MLKKDLIEAWKNPVARQRLDAVAHPSGDVFAELREEDLQDFAGGAASTEVAKIDTNTLTTSTSIFISRYLGNDGWICTATKECMPSCN